MRIVTVNHAGRIMPGVIDDDGSCRALGGPVEGGEVGAANMVSASDIVASALSTEGRETLSALAGAAESVPLDQVELLCPIPDVRRVLCVGTNYADHVAESDRVTDPTATPMLFTRFASSFVNPGAPVVRPAISDHFDYEGELAVIIGRRGHRLDRDDALSVIGGYACFLDGTLRDYQRHTSQFTPGKTADRTGSWGPWIVTADEIDDPYELRLTTTVNGEVMQEASTRQLIFDIEAIISYCSQFMTLEPGDVIATGTPGGVGYARTPPRWLIPGDEVAVTVTGMGTLTNGVIDEADLTATP